MPHANNSLELKRMLFYLGVFSSGRRDKFPKHLEAELKKSYAHIPFVFPAEAYTLGLYWLYLREFKVEYLFKTGLMLVQDMLDDDAQELAFTTPNLILIHGLPEMYNVAKEIKVCEVVASRQARSLHTLLLSAKQEGLPPLTVERESKVKYD